MLENVNKKPEDLKPEELEKAKGLAGKLTSLRKFLYFFFSIASAAGFILLSMEYVDWAIVIVLAVLMIPYTLFKIRDFVRGTI